ncbi:hypothetical protein PHSC3_000137 [Chlamydiales bacterium STE3]|nr:hypothetical protein PHSC3_000137 [Chlamydiales bacterium STE3]
MSSQLPLNDPDQKPSFKDKFRQALHTLKESEKSGRLSDLAASSTRDSIAYVILIVGIILLFFHPFYGGFLIGLIGGFYFSSELLAFLQSINHLIDEQGIVRSLIAGALLIGLLICAPAIFLGIAAAVGIRQILFPPKS